MALHIPPGDDPVEFLKLLLIEPALFAAPVLAFVGCRLPRNTQPGSLKRCLAGLLTLAGVGAFVNFSSWSIRGPVLNTLCGAVGYLAAITVWFAIASLLPQKPMRVIMRVPPVLPLALGLLLGTVGILGLMFIIGDSTARTEGSISPGYIYRICYTGGAYTSVDTAEVEIVRRWYFLPIEHTVWRRSYDDHAFDFAHGLSVTDLLIIIKRSWRLPGRVAGSIAKGWICDEEMVRAPRGRDVAVIVRAMYIESR